MKHSCLLFFLFRFLVASAHEEAFVHDYAHQLAQLEHRNQQTPGSASDEWLLDVREATVQTAFPLDGNVQTQVRQKVNTVHRQHPMVRVYVLVSAAIGFDPKDAKLQDWFTSHQQSFEEGPRADDPAHYASEIVDHWTEEGERSEPYKIMLLHFQQVINGAQAYWDVTYGMENTFTNDFLTQFHQNLRLLVNNSNVALNPSGSIYDNIRLVGMAIDNNGASQSKYNIKTTIGDTLMTLNKIYIPTHMRHDPIFKFVPSDSTTSFVNIKLKIVSAENKTGAFYPSTGYLKLDKNTAVTLDLDSLQEGKYQIQCEGTNSCLVNYFYIRKKKAKIPCKYCGRELEFSKELLVSIFGINSLANKNDQLSSYFNKSMEVLNMNSCKTICHVLSQIKIESNNFTKITEDGWYRLSGLLTTFKKNTNGVCDSIYRQVFWDNKNYLRYVTKAVFYRVDTNRTIKGKYVKSIEETFYRPGRRNDSIRFPTDYKLNAKGNYNEIVYTRKLNSDEIDTIQKRMFNLVYMNKDGNGGFHTNEGFLYSGKGFIQLTTKNNYIKANDILIDKFKKNFNIVSNPDVLKENYEAAVYASFIFFYMNYSPISKLDGKSSVEVTSIVNIKGEKENERKEAFNSFINTYYYDCKTY